MKKTRLLWIFLLLLALAYIITGMSRISFNIDILKLLPAHLHQVEGLSLFLKNFALPDELIITVEAPDSDLAKATASELAKRLRSRPDLVKNCVAAPPWEENPAGLAEFMTFVLLNQSEEESAQLEHQLSSTQAASTLHETLDELNSSLSPADLALLGYDPFRIFSFMKRSGLLNLSKSSEFASADGRFRVLYVQAPRSFANYRETSRWLDSVKALCHQVSSSSPNVNLGFTGEPAFVSEISLGMEWDMISSSFVTLGLISLIFWLCYRRLLPLCWLLLMLQLIFVFSLATAGLFLKELTVIGAGFASVMIGLSVDYGYFIYQKSLTHTGSLRSLQWDCFQNIIWTAGTTAAAFFALNLSNLPGLSQLGNMVGIGVCIGAVVMVLLFAPLAMKARNRTLVIQQSRLAPFFNSPRFAHYGQWITLCLVLLLLGGLIFKGFPKTDFSPSTFRPKVSESQSTIEKLSARLHEDRDSLSLIVTGKNEAEVLARLSHLQNHLTAAMKRGEIKHFLSPLTIWPNAELQKKNISLLDVLSHELPRLKTTLHDNGFTAEASTLTSSILQQAHDWKDAALPLWPSNQTSKWILHRLVHHQEGNFVALGIIDPAPGRDEELIRSFQEEGVYLVSWKCLGMQLRQNIPSEIIRVASGLIAGILLLLAIALQNVRTLLLFVLTTTLVLTCLAGAMSLLGMTWGFFNLAAVLLLLGTGTDYSILLLLSRKRHGGDARKAQGELALVIFLCCTSAAAGFGSLAWAGNMGLATLGKTCALGLLLDGMISLFLLPRACELLFPSTPSSAASFQKDLPLT